LIYHFDGDEVARHYLDGVERAHSNIQLSFSTFKDFESASLAMPSDGAGSLVRASASDLVSGIIDHAGGHGAFVVAFHLPRNLSTELNGLINHLD
jgi:hypothetical protein